VSRPLCPCDCVNCSGCLGYDGANDIGQMEEALREIAKEPPLLREKYVYGMNSELIRLRNIARNALTAPE